MPISGGKYVAPTWHNNAAPALDETELQAMTDTIEENQEPQSSAVQLSAEAQAALGLGSGSTLDDAMELLGNAKIKFGSYVGTGTDTRTLSFDDAPKAVFIYFSLRRSSVVSMVSLSVNIPGHDDFANGEDIDYMNFDGASTWSLTNCSWNSAGTSFTFTDETSSSAEVLNQSNTTYYYCYFY